MTMGSPWIDACGRWDYIYLENNLSYTFTLHSRAKSWGVLDTIQYAHVLHCFNETCFCANENLFLPLCFIARSDDQR